MSFQLHFTFVHSYFTVPNMNEIHIGAAVRRLRETRNLTLRAVAEQAGFSASFLSQVENEQASPSISSMERIAAALGVTLGEFFQTVEQNPARVIRADSRQTLYSGWSNARLESLAGGEFSRLQPILITLKPGGTSGKRPAPAPLEEFAFVFSGSAVLTIQDVDHELNEGDAVSIPRGALRRWQNVTRTPTQVVLVSVQ
jgi:transcriptional regulator with XRE-family HTH domain